MKIVREHINEIINFKKFEPFTIEIKKRGEDMIYKFIENHPGFEHKPNKETIIYTYSLNKGNIYMKNPDKYATTEIRSNSNAFNKGNPNKMAVPNNLKMAEEIIKNHYFKYNARQNEY